MRILEKFIYTQRMEMRRKIGEVFKAGRLDVGWSIEEASQASGIRRSGGFFLSFFPCLAGGIKNGAEISAPPHGIFLV